MISAIKSGVSFGKTNSTQQDRVKELNHRKSLNSQMKFGLNTAIVAGYLAGTTAITKTTKGKSYPWNTAVNKAVKNFSENIKDFKGAEKLKEIANKFAKTSARQKLLGAATFAALSGLFIVTNHFSGKQGELNAEIKNISQ